jgi:transposase
MKKPQKRYDATFKRDAVELLLTSGRPLKVLAVELGVCDVTLRGWRDRHLAKTQPIESDGKKLSAQQLALELRRVQKELATANRRNEILKKPWAFFPRNRSRTICPYEKPGRRLSP